MSDSLKVLLVDDDPTLRLALCDSFEIAGIEVDTASDAAAALGMLSDLHGAVITDLRMPGMDGLQLRSELRARDPHLPVILMTGHGDITMAVNALKDGAFDFLAKPFATDHLIASARRALETRALFVENQRLRARAEGFSSLKLLGETPVMVRLRQTISQLAAVEVDVLIEGEIGTGKRKAAQYLHRLGPRRSRAFVAIDCAALPGAIAEETLFGSRTQRGALAEADRGVLYLNEIDSLPPALQGRLLSVMETGELAAHGSGPAQSLNLRVIAACRGDLARAVAEGRFRADLYYKLETVRLRLPPLRERRADVDLLFSVFLRDAAEHLHLPIPQVDAATAARLATDDWPGNVNELENFATRLVLGLGEAASQEPDLPLAEQMDRFEAGVLRRNLDRLGGDVTEVARLLGMPRRSLYARLQRHGIEASAFRGREGQAGRHPGQGAKGS